MAAHESPPLASLLRMPVSTPIVWRSAGDFNTSQPPKRDRELEAVADEISGRFLGPIEAKNFFAEFMPVGYGKPPAVASTHFGEVKKVKVERQMYKPFVDAVTELKLPNLKFIDTSDHPDGQCGDMKPDIGVYLKSVENVTTAFALMELWGEFKCSRDADGFRDPFTLNDERESDATQTEGEMGHPVGNKWVFEHDTNVARETRGQIASYAAALLATQFRTHAFSFLLTGATVRFIRWDRSCAIVSKAIPYVSQPEFLVEFFWRYSQLSAEQRGHDASATEPTEMENKMAAEKLGLLGPTRFVKLMMPSSDIGAEPCHYIVPAPAYMSRSPFGRCTRAYRAYHTKRQAIVFMKDYWRVHAESIEKEGDIYKDLDNHKVPHIPPFDCGDDVFEHETLGHTIPLGMRRKMDIDCYRHYRMGILTVGRSLLSFKSSYEYVNAITDAMEAHQCALIRARILHRDISIGNILIDEGGGGLLIDWDLCARVGRLAHVKARQFGRTGTWQFISAALLQQMNKLHDHQDDRESALHLLNWIGLKYTLTNQDPYQLRKLLRSFDERDVTGDGVAGGDMKIYELVTSYYPGHVTFCDRPLLDQLVVELTETFRTRYVKAPSASSNESLQLALQYLETFQSKGHDVSADIAWVEEEVRTTELMKWRECQEHLDEGSNWFVDTLRKYLTDKRDLWPENDGVETITLAVGNKRRQESDTSSDNGGATKKLHYWSRP